eukprot:GHVP01004786.1.p1 GENE.GHVP01004786.1~~GHVP01004786.1.p1  ORF type:complete len:488 (+),score=88.80 GHVP01004786.1:52-1464(+)
MEKVFLPNAAVPLMPREPEFISLNPPILEENLDAEAKKKIHSRRYSLSHSHSHRNRNRHRHRQNDSSLSSSSLLSYTGILIGVVVTSLALWTAWTTTWKTASQPTTDYDLPNTQNHPSNKDVKPQRGTKDLEAGQNLNQSPKEDQKRKDNGCFSDTSPSTGDGTKDLEAGQNLNQSPKEDQKRKDDVEAEKDKPAGWISNTSPSIGDGTIILKENSDSSTNLNHSSNEDQTQSDKTSFEKPQSCQELIQVFCNSQNEMLDFYMEFCDLVNSDDFLKGCCDEARKFMNQEPEKKYNVSWYIDLDPEHPVLTAEKSKTISTEKTIEGQKVTFVHVKTREILKREVLCKTKNYHFFVNWFSRVKPIWSLPEKDADCPITKAFSKFISLRKSFSDAKLAITEFLLKSESFQKEFDSKMPTKFNTFSKKDIFDSLQEYFQVFGKPEGGDFKNFEVTVKRDEEDWKLKICPILKYS